VTDGAAPSRPRGGAGSLGSVDVLGAFLLMLLAALVSTVLVAVLVVVLAQRAIRKRNRVSPAVPSAAPTSWLGAPSAAARLHRRLKAAVAVAQAAAAAAPTSDHIVEAAVELERMAVDLDARLVTVARIAAPQRKPHLAPLVAEVVKVETMASTLSVQAVQAQAPMVAGGHSSPMDDLYERIEAMEAARREVADIERDAGVDRVSPYAAQPPVAPQPAPPSGRRRGGTASPA
jgi:hypothetical protein